MRILFLHPDLAKLSCRDCLTYMTHDNKLYRRQGQLVRRGPGQRPPCAFERPDGSSTHCEKGKPYTSELWPANYAALWHWRECSATGIFPDDPTVKQNAAIISQINKLAELSYQQMMLSSTFGRVK